MAATIRDIKKQTGLSLATISKYLNGGNVLPENKIKIEAAIKDLHYEVNELARGLVTNKTKTVGVVVFSIESLFNGTLLHHIGNSLRKAGYGMLICDSNDDIDREADNIKFLINKKVDGIIVIPISNTSDFLKPAKNANIPVVLLDRKLKTDEFDCIKINNTSAARRAARELLDAGHEKIAIISSNAEYTGIERHKGFIDELKTAGIDMPDDYIFRGSHSIELGYDGMKHMLSLSDRPTAVFMTNYEVTLGAVMAVNESPIRCPDDISLLGFDDLIMSHVVEPRMTMVVQPMEEMGQSAVDVLLKRIDSKEEYIPAETVMSTKILQGNSIKKLK